MNSDYSESKTPLSVSPNSSPMLMHPRARLLFRRLNRSAFGQTRLHRVMKNFLFICIGVSFVSLLWIAHNISTALWHNVSYKCVQSIHFAGCTSTMQSLSIDHLSVTQTISTQNPLAMNKWKPTLTTKDHLYGVVFDAGSTGSRVHVFELKYNHSDWERPYVLINEVFEQVKPGLSSFADNPQEAVKSLAGLLRKAEQSIPPGLCRYSPVILRATAGLRLLSVQKADNILNAIRAKLFTTCFLKPANPVTILDGLYEGLYLWISLNFLHERLPNVNTIAKSRLASTNLDVFQHTIGTLDLGGGSTQITFAPSDLNTLNSAPRDFLTSLNPKRSNDAKLIYSHSYLGLGLMSARYSMLHRSTKRLGPSYNRYLEFYTPCWPSNHSEYWEHAGHKWRINYLPHEAASDLLSRSESDHVREKLVFQGMSWNSAICYALALTVLKDPVEGEQAAPVFPPTGYIVHQPAELSSRDFYAFSYFFDLASSVGLIDSKLGGEVKISDFMHSFNSICQNPVPDSPFDCMDVSYITALLHEGYGFPLNKTLTLRKKVKSFEISWSLGALFAELFDKEHV